ncbi:MAG TPA: hypothetical protein VFE61_18350 [Candidatus Sulfotelmatobacter sp.]|nr:hypothetical protein [Candidatus Sulfotelmatobacter sp.]
MKNALILLFMFCSVAVAEDKSLEQTSQPTLTIYNQNFFVARERFSLDLKSGPNRVEYAGIASHLEPDSVILRDPAGRSLQILEQNYRNDPISQELLLSLYEGKTIDFVIGQNGDKQITAPGRIVRSGYVSSSPYASGYAQPAYTQPIIEMNGVLRFGLPGLPLFPALTGGSILKPTLNWLLQTSAPGKFDAEISYVSSGMNWQADYNLVVSEQPNSKTDALDMIGWITMHNQSGKTYEDARIKLMAGDVNKIQEGSLSSRVYAGVAKAMEADASAPVVREKSFDEFHLYTLERPTTLHDQETKQVEFVRATGIRAQRIYVYDGARLDQYGYYNPDQVRQDAGYGTLSNSKISVMEEFKNSDTNHLGIPLPKGKLRFYRADTDGHLEFVGENTIDHTPKDETIRVYTGNAFDVVGERKRTNFRVDSNQHWMEESFEIRVRNHKKETANVRVVEHLYRCANWKLTEQSHPSRKMDAHTVELPVTVAADGEAVVSYTVHYSW